MHYQTLSYKKLADQIGVITLQREQVLNALNLQLLQELNLVLDHLIELKCLIITGSGKAFAAGADIAEMQNLSASEAAKLANFGAKVFSKIENLPFPVIAMVNGFALGGGCELALACDLRIASEQAKFGQPEVGLGIIPGFGGTQRLSRLVGLARAKELIFTGKMISAPEAEKLGLINKMTASEDLWSVTAELATQICKNSAAAVSAAKQAIDIGMQTDLNSGLQMEANLFGICFSTADQKEGMSAFLAKRKARF